MTIHDRKRRNRHYVYILLAIVLLSVGAALAFFLLPRQTDAVQPVAISASPSPSAVQPCAYFRFSVQHPDPEPIPGQPVPL